MNEAVAELKEALGPDAVILGTRRGRDGRGRYVEISAEAPQEQPMAQPITHAVGQGGRRASAASAAYLRASAAPADPPPARPATDKPFAKRAVWLAKEVAKRQEPAQPPSETHVVREELAALRAAIHGLHRPDESESKLEGVVHALRRELADLKVAVAAGVAVPQERPSLDRMATVLAELGLGAELTEALCEVAGPDRALDGLADHLAGQIDVVDALPAAGERRILAFVGPTGVGKTTTIAKVAARAQLLDGLRTALVTVDTFRMAAVEQLARYADILDCPLHVVKHPDDLSEVLSRLQDVDLVLIDTTGRNPRAADQVRALARFFPEGWGGQSVLTVAGSTRERDLSATLKAFDALHYDFVCVTKMDETDAVGVPIGVAHAAGRPLTWLTCGQRVPEDIERARPKTLASRVIKGVLAGLAAR